jgi:DNA-binding response OmpR family regulator
METVMRHRILIADDEPNILLSLEFLMKREGYDVVVVQDGEKAFEAIVRDRPDLVLLDVMMPIKSGFEVCQQVRATDGISHIPILMLTAKGRDTDIAKGMAMGATAYLTKPFSTREMAQKVRELLERRV